MNRPRAWKKTGATLKEIRIKYLGLTLDDLGSVFGVSKQFLSQMESGYNRPPNHVFIGMLSLRDKTIKTNDRIVTDTILASALGNDVFEQLTEKK